MENLESTERYKENTQSCHSSECPSKAEIILMMGLNLFALNEITLVILLGHVQSGSCVWVTRMGIACSVLKKEGGSLFF